MDRKRPVAGIGFGQAGYWANRHFSSLDLARSAYEQHCAGLRNQNTIETSIEPNSTIVAGAKFHNRLKNGKPGKMVHTVQLYLISDRQADSYLASSPFYTVEA